MKYNFLQPKLLNNIFFCFFAGSEAPIWPLDAKIHPKFGLWNNTKLQYSPAES